MNIKNMNFTENSAKWAKTIQNNNYKELRRIESEIRRMRRSTKAKISTLKKQAEREKNGLTSSTIKAEMHRQQQIASDYLNLAEEINKYAKGERQRFQWSKLVAVNENFLNREARLKERLFERERFAKTEQETIEIWIKNVIVKSDINNLDFGKIAKYDNYFQEKFGKTLTNYMNVAFKDITPGKNIYEEIQNTFNNIIENRKEEVSKKMRNNEITKEESDEIMNILSQLFNDTVGGTE